MEAAFAPRVNLVRQVAEVANYPCWLIKSSVETEAHKNIVNLQYFERYQ